MIFSEFPSRCHLRPYYAADSDAASPARLPQIVVAASGGGSNFQAVIDAQRSGKLQAEISGLITSSAAAGAIKRAKKASIPHIVLSDEEKKSSFQLQLRLLEMLCAWKCDVFVLAGFMLKIPEAVIAQYRGRILNIHPSLLPKFGGKGFYGIRVHQAVLSAGEAESGCTVHIVNEAFDEGPVLEQVRVAVQPDDTPEELAARVLAEEHRLYPAAINRFMKQLKSNKTSSQP